MNFLEILIPLSSKSEAQKKYPKAIFVKDRLLLITIFILGIGYVLAPIPKLWFLGGMTILLLIWNWDVNKA